MTGKTGAGMLGAAALGLPNRLQPSPLQTDKINSNPQSVGRTRMTDSGSGGQ
jgi:hypothetical protein